MAKLKADRVIRNIADYSDNELRQLHSAIIAEQEQRGIPTERSALYQTMLNTSGDGAKIDKILQEADKHRQKLEARIRELEQDNSVLYKFMPEILKEVPTLPETVIEHFNSLESKYAPIESVKGNMLAVIPAENTILVEVKVYAKEIKQKDHYISASNIGVFHGNIEDVENEITPAIHAAMWRHPQRSDLRGRDMLMGVSEETLYSAVCAVSAHIYDDTLTGHESNQRRKVFDEMLKSEIDPAWLNGTGENEAFNMFYKIVRRTYEAMHKRINIMANR